MVMSPLMPTLYYPKQRLQRLAEDASPVLAGGSINYATFLHEHRPCPPAHAALVGTVQQSCLNSLNVRKLSLAVREKSSPERGTRGHESWHRLCVLRKS